jgi:hypothetical protein
MATDLERARTEYISGSLGGFPALLVHGLGWLALSAAFVWAAQAGHDVRGPALGLILMGAVTLPASFALQAALNLPATSVANPVNLLGPAASLALPAMLPALIIVLMLEPAYVAAVYAVLTGAHYLPFAWIQRTRWYVTLALGCIAAGGLTALILRADSSAAACLLVGIFHLIVAFAVRARARRAPAA